MALPGSKTTQPANSTERTGRSGLGLAITWLHPGKKPTLLPLSSRNLSLGRAEDSDFQLEGSECSRNHARIKREGLLTRLVDLDSRNGIFVNGERVKETALADGQILRLGEWVGLVEELPPAEAEDQCLPRELAPDLLGGHRMQAVLEPLRRVASSDLPVIIEGETGTGKERVARALHLWSGRKGPFVAVNCAALPEQLAEGELFGYRKGAFTGADRDHPGYFRSAHGGTLLLDELIDMPPALQPKLLRVLEEGEVHPLGESRPVPIDVRVVSATQESLEAAAGDGRFRADLFARLDGLCVHVPPLRQRRADVVALFHHFLNDRTGGRPPLLEPKLVEALCLYDFPFNVRELSMLCRKLTALHGTQTQLNAKLLPARMHKPSVSSPPAEPPPIERLAQALRQQGGNLAAAARSLGISRQQAYRLMEREGLDLQGLRTLE